MPYLPQFQNDIYISYAHLDNFQFSPTTPGWVDDFHKYLEAELNRRSAWGAVSIWRDVRRDEIFIGDLQRAIEKSAIFIPLISNAYLSSRICREELKTFYDAAERTYGVKVGNDSRIFPVELQRGSRDRWPPEIGNLGVLGYPFYEGDLDMDDLGSPADPRNENFRKKIRELARDILNTLESFIVASQEETAASAQTPTQPVDPAPTAKSAIFISYRRGEGTPYAGRLYDQLATRFGEDRVFMDLDTIEPGDDFVEVITNYVSSCTVLIALIHKAWLDAKDDEGRARLHNPDDFVSIEISTALQRNIRVIPVLVQGASMPRSQDLPESMSILSRRNALELSDSRWRSDVSKLIKILEKHL